MRILLNNKVIKFPNIARRLYLHNLVYLFFGINICTTIFHRVIKRENSPISPELSSSNSMNCSANDGEENEKKLNKTTDKITHIGSLNKGVLFHDNHLFHLHKFNYAKCIASTHINNITRPDKTYFCTIPDAH